MNLDLTHDPWLAPLARSQVKQSFASNEACKLTMTGTRGDILYQCGAGGVHPLVVSSIPLKKTLVFHIVRRSRSRMEAYYFINFIFIFAVNVFLFFSGICLNPLVILSFWRSVQLRKKLCYSMIIVLSCCDLLTLLTNNPLMALISMSWLTGKVDGNTRWPHISLRSANIVLGFSLFALLVMNFDRYLATSYPIFHRTSVTKGRLLTLLAILIIVEITLKVMSVNDFVISDGVHTNMVQYHDTIRMVNFINPPSTISIVVDLYPLYSASLPVVPVVRYGYGS